MHNPYPTLRLICGLVLGFILAKSQDKTLSSLTTRLYIIRPQINCLSDCVFVNRFCVIAIYYLLLLLLEVYE